MNTYGKIQKYLVLLSSFFILVVFSHLIFLYIYKDSQVVPTEGGNISMGIVAPSPDLSLLSPNTDYYNDLVMRFVFRSVLRFHPTTKNVEGDLMNCNTSTLPYVSCFLNADVTWDTGEPITTKDIIASYAVYKTPAFKNRRLAAILADLKISEEKGGIRFSFGTKDIASLEALFLPIVKAAQAQGITAENFNLADMSFSGPYRFIGQNTDKSGEQILLERNPAFHTDQTYVSRFTLRFFASLSELSRNRNSLHVVHAPFVDQLKDLPRLSDTQYTLPQYYAFFLNSETVSVPLRKILLSDVISQVIPSAPSLDAKDPLLSAFHTLSGSSASGSSFSAIVEKMGYLTKEQLLAQAQKKVPTLEKKIIVPEPKALKYFVDPSMTPAFLIGDRVLLSGKVPTGTDQVKVNGASLTKFSLGDERFYYRMLLSRKTEKIGKNDVVATFLKHGKILGQEKALVYLANDKKQSEEQQEEWKQEFSTTLTLTGAPQETSTGRIAAIQELSQTGFYDTNLVPFTLKIAYVPAMESVADTLASLLFDRGIATEQISLDDPSSVLQANGKQYDILVTGIGLGIFGNNLYPYFHSGQSEVGYNFAKIRNLPLDILLEKLRGEVSTDATASSLYTQTLRSIADLAVFYPVHSSFLHAMIDKNIGGITPIQSLPGFAYWADIFRTSYIRYQRLILWKEKSFPGFFDFLSAPFSR